MEQRPSAYGYLFRTWESPNQEAEDILKAFAHKVLALVFLRKVADDSLCEPTQVVGRRRLGEPRTKLFSDYCLKFWILTGVGEPPALVQCSLFSSEARAVSLLAN
jgi:hypothetical protein